MPAKVTSTARSAATTWVPFFAGVVGFGVLLYFYGGDFSVRVALALAAAGIMTVIPGFLEIDNKFVKAGGPVAAMVLVLFSDQIGQQFHPESQAPGSPSVVRLSKDQLRYLSEIAAAQFDIAQGQNSVAIETLEHARKLNADPKLALHMLGSVYFKERNYAKAAAAFEEGFRPGDPDSGRLAYNAALSHQVVGETEAAKKWIDLANQNIARAAHPELWREMTFDRGLIYMSAWLRNDAPKPTLTFEIAASSFHQFLEAEPKAVYWAQYDIACLHATSADHYIARKLPASEIYARAVAHFEQFLKGLTGLDGKVQEYQVKLARTVLLIDNALSAQREPGGPVDCPALRKAWEETGNKWDDVVRKLSTEAAPREARL